MDKISRVYIVLLMPLLILVFLVSAFFSIADKLIEAAKDVFRTAVFLEDSIKTMGSRLVRGLLCRLEKLKEGRNAKKPKRLYC